MSDSPDWGLRLRMVLSVVLLFVVTAAFFGFIWWLIRAAIVLTGGQSATTTATIITSLLILAIIYLEFIQQGLVTDRADATPVTREQYPKLYELVTKVARMYDEPVPTVALSGDHEPKALVVGYTPENTQLILSKGVVDSLSGKEIEAVIAHEMAHVANRDAMVMTIVSLPVMAADGLRSRLLKILHGAAGGSRSSSRSSSSSSSSGWRVGVSSRSSGGKGGAARAFLVILTVKLLLITVATVVYVLSRTIVAVLSRSREVAADEAAAEVISSPSNLSSALATLDDTVQGTPTRDLREAADVSAMSIIPLEPQTVEPTMLGPEGSHEPFLWSVRAPIRRKKKRLFRTHPETKRRIERITAKHGRS